MKKAIKYLALTSAGFAVYLLFGASCVPTTAINVSGILFGRPIETTVDDRLAMRMLAEPESQEVRALFAAHQNEALNTNTLARIATMHSMDVATLYFLQRAYHNERNAQAQDRYLELLDQLGADTGSDPLAALHDHYMVFVPGLDYNDTTNGGNFARQRRLLTAAGVANELVMTDAWGLTEANAAVVAARLRTLSAEHDKIIVVSASKGGLETAMALGRVMEPEETEHIKAWVSVGGILKGSPVADSYLHWPNCWLAEFGLFLKGQRINLLQDVSYAKRADEFDALVFPEHIKCVHFIGAPLTAQVTKRIRSHYCAIKVLGPNDGITPLADEVSENGIIISELGLDHYYSSPDIDTKTIALALVVADPEPQDNRE